MEKENTKAFRKCMENAVNRLCYDAMADAKEHSGRVIDEVMAFTVIDALAKAPDWNFDGRNSAACKIAAEIAALPNFPLWLAKTREKYPKVFLFAEEFCENSLFQMHPTLQQGYVGYLLACIQIGENEGEKYISSQMSEKDPYWAKMPFI